jgi:hypothetical protein
VSEEPEIVRAREMLHQALEKANATVVGSPEAVSAWEAVEEILATISHIKDRL